MKKKGNAKRRPTGAVGTGKGGREGKEGRLGRPRSFDTEDALDRAMMVFWKQGYEGASLTDLTKAMGINRPSLYAAFGDKESLFRKVVDHYVARHSHHLQSAVDEPTARKVIERLWANTINSVTSAGGPNGCLLVQGALACSADAKNAQKEVCKWRAAAETALRERFERAIEAGDLPKGTDAAAMARFAATVNQGIAVQASGGATKVDLKRVAEIALRGIAGG